MQYRVKVETYSNKADNDRYTVSLSPARSSIDAPVYVPTDEEFRLWRKIGRAPDPELYIPSYYGERLGMRFNKNSPRDQASIMFAVRNIRAIGLSNDWDYFFTFTLDADKVSDRSDVKGNAKRMQQRFRDLRKRGYEITALMIPELHKDKVNYHYHGLMSCDPALLDIHPLKRFQERGWKYFPDFHERFGFTALSPVKHTNFVVLYCLKYINKDLFSTTKNDGRKLYYTTGDLKRPVTVSDDVVSIDRSDLVSLDQVHYNVKFDTANVRGLTSEQLQDFFKAVSLDSSIVFTDPDPVDECFDFSQDVPVPDSFEFNLFDEVYHG